MTAPNKAVSCQISLPQIIRFGEGVLSTLGRRSRENES